MGPLSVFCLFSRWEFSCKVLIQKGTRWLHFKAVLRFPYHKEKQPKVNVTFNATLGILSEKVL